MHIAERTACEEQRSPWGTRMTTIIESLETVSLEDALAYLDTAEGDELAAAFALAQDRNLLDGLGHHALGSLQRRRGLLDHAADHRQPARALLKSCRSARPIR